MPPANPIRNRASVVVIHDQCILGFHAEDPHSKKRYFLLPGGGIEEWEDANQAAVRECLEETGYSIRLLPERKTFRRYDFYWNQTTYDSRTWFFLGELAEAYRPPGPVTDVDYHRGVAWIPLSLLEETFDYCPAVLDAILKLWAKP